LTLLVLPLLYRLAHRKEEEEELGAVDSNKLEAQPA
jgi:cobalt-zinc-cadmium resistance protein CzcA